MDFAVNHIASLAAVFGVIMWLLNRYPVDIWPDDSARILPPEILEWKQKGSFVRYLDLQVYTQRVPYSGSKADSDTLLLIHGFPTSSFDYRHTVAQLSTRYHVIMFDFPGYGLSSKPDASLYSYSLIDQADCALFILRYFNVSAAHLMAHDMGDSVAQELLARRQRSLLPWLRILSVTFNNGGMLVDLHIPRLSQILLRVPYVSSFFASLSSYPVFSRQVHTILKQPTTLPESELEFMWELTLHNGGRRRVGDLIQYIGERWRFEHPRWLPALNQSDSVPIHLIWGVHDTVAPISIATQLVARFQKFRLSKIEDAGHFPMLESPQSWLRAVLS